MGKLQIAVRIPYFGAVTKGDIADVVRIADQAGFHSGWVGDHIVYPTAETASRNDTIPHGKYPEDLMAAPAYEALTVLAFAAAASERVRLGVGCCIVPQRQPLLLAKQVASIDHLAGGRVIFGAVGGWLEDEFTALGMPFADRGARLEESIALMRACWEAEKPSWKGKHYAFESIHFQPKPAQRPLPVWFGGMTETSFKRAARLGDGWYGSRLTVEDATRISAKLAAYRAEGPRAGQPFTVMASTFGKQPTDRDAIAERIARYEGTGVDVVMLDSEIREGRAAVALASAAAEVVG
jgi:probable F420-dependent oxidoreductase